MIQNFNNIKTQKPNCKNCEILTRASVLQESAQEDFEKKKQKAQVRLLSISPSKYHRQLEKYPPPPAGLALCCF
jgi:adenine-specific DNA glycosylase